MTVGDRLRKARQRLGKRQLDIAVEVGCTQPTVHAWETDDYLPRPKKVRIVARAYRIAPSLLLPRAA